MENWNEGMAYDGDFCSHATVLGYLVGCGLMIFVNKTLMETGKQYCRQAHHYNVFEDLKTSRREVEPYQLSLLL